MNNGSPLCRIVLPFLLLGAVTPYFLSLSASAIWDSNEAFYAETPRVMVDSGDYVNPSFNENPRFNKPPLVYWIVAGFYNLFGVSEAVERIPIAIGAAALIAAAVIFGKMMYSIESGLYAGLILAATPRFLMFSRRIIIDVYVALFMVLAILFFALSLRGGRRRTWLTLMYVSIGLGVMTKGPVAAVLPGLAILAYIAVFKKWNLLRRMMLPAGILVIALIVLPWYVAIHLEHGWSHILTFLLQDNVSRFLEPSWGPHRSVFFYIGALFGDMLPWSILIPSTALMVAARLRSGRTSEAVDQTSRFSDKHNDDQVIRIIVIWILAVMIFFSLSRSKEDLYILPVYPAMAALMGVWLARLRSAPDRPSRFSISALALLVFLGGVALMYVVGTAPGRLGLRGLIPALMIIAVAGVLGLALTLTGRRVAAPPVLIGAFAIFNWIFALAILPDFERFRPVKPLAEIIRNEADPSALVGYYRLASPSMVFYLRRPIFEFYRQEQLREAFESGDQVFCILLDRDYEEIKSTLPPNTYVLATRPIFQVKWRSVFEGTDLPGVHLITNKEDLSAPRAQ